MGYSLRKRGNDELDRTPEKTVLVFPYMIHRERGDTRNNMRYANYRKYYYHKSGFKARLAVLLRLLQSWTRTLNRRSPGDAGGLNEKERTTEICASEHGEEDAFIGASGVSGKTATKKAGLFQDED